MSLSHRAQTIARAMPKLSMQVAPQKAGGGMAQARSIRGGLSAVKNDIGIFPRAQSGEQRRVQSSCSPDDPFSVTSSLYPDQEGCYVIFETTPGSVTYATEDFISFILEMARDQDSPDSVVSCRTNPPPPSPPPPPPPRKEGSISGNAGLCVRGIEIKWRTRHPFWPCLIFERSGLRFGLVAADVQVCNKSSMYIPGRCMRGFFMGGGGMSFVPYRARAIAVIAVYPI